jgi:hypothetical protein
MRNLHPDTPIRNRRARRMLARQLDAVGHAAAAHADRLAELDPETVWGVLALTLAELVEHDPSPRVTARRTRARRRAPRRRARRSSTKALDEPPAPAPRSSDRGAR